MAAFLPHNNIYAFLLPLLLFFVMSFGGVISAGMMSRDGKMSDCPYMGMSGYCDMNASEHFAGWQQLFSATTEHFFDSTLLPLLTIAILTPFFIQLLVRKRPQRPVFQRWRMLQLFDPLRLAFARGIIHPKLFS